MTHGWNGFREVESASYDGRVIQCLCGENFVDAVDYGKHLAATGASTPGFEGRYDTEQPLQGHLVRLYELRQRTDEERPVAAEPIRDEVTQ